MASERYLQNDLDEASRTAQAGSYDEALHSLNCAARHIREMRSNAATGRSGSGGPDTEVGMEVEVGKRVDLEVEARSWLEDCGADPDDLDERNTMEVFEEVNRLHEGGWTGFLRSLGI